VPTALCPPARKAVNSSPSPRERHPRLPADRRRSSISAGVASDLWPAVEGQEAGIRVLQHRGPVVQGAPQRLRHTRDGPLAFALDREPDFACGKRYAPRSPRPAHASRIPQRASGRHP
jgi:hypothetical protein